ncbi:hypothetical protein HDZ31DRAFT_78405, partial [Schizophyllum fasciatum]
LGQEARHWALVLDQVRQGIQERTPLIRLLPAKLGLGFLEDTPNALVTLEGASDRDVSGVESEAGPRGSYLTFSLVLARGDPLTSQVHLGYLRPGGSYLVAGDTLAKLEHPLPDELEGTLLAKRVPLPSPWLVEVDVLTEVLGQELSVAWNPPTALEASPTPSPSDTAQARLAPTSGDLSPCMWAYLEDTCRWVKALECTWWVLTDVWGADVACISHGFVTWVAESWFASAPLCAPTAGFRNQKDCFALTIHATASKGRDPRHQQESKQAWWTHEYLANHRKIFRKEYPLIGGLDEFDDKYCRSKHLSQSEDEAWDANLVGPDLLLSFLWKGPAAFTSAPFAFQKFEWGEQVNAKEALIAAYVRILQLFVGEDPLDLDEIERAIHPLPLPPAMSEAAEEGQTRPPMPQVVAHLLECNVVQIKGGCRLWAMLQREDLPQQLAAYRQATCMRRKAATAEAGKRLVMFSFTQAARFLLDDGT